MVLLAIGSFGALARRSAPEFFSKNHEAGDESGLPPTASSHDLLPSPVFKFDGEITNSWKYSTKNTLLVGSAKNDTCGLQVANIGDFNNDGYADFAIGCHLTNKFNKINNGQVFVFFSREKWFEPTKLSNFVAGN